MSRYETLLLELLRRLDEKADRIAVALEKMSPPGGQDREAIERIVDDRVKRMLLDSLPGDLRPAESRKKLADTIRNILTEQVQKLGNSPQKLVGFSPAGFNQILVFVGDNPTEDIMAANPRMSEILRDDDHHVYIWGIKAAAN